MQLPIDKDDYGIAALAVVYGWAVSHMAAIWLALPMWAQHLLQCVITLTFGLGALTAQHFWRRYLHRRWPNREQQDITTEDTHKL